MNRGPAILGDRLFMATVDAKMLALDAKAGRLLWKTGIENYRTGHAATVAPLAVKDKVTVGIAGGEYGMRGFIDAYYAATGERAWRFYTIPGPGDPNFGTWEGDSWNTGAAPASPKACSSKAAAAKAARRSPSRTPGPSRSAQVGSSIEAAVRDTPAPLAIQWNSNVQREWPGQMLLEVCRA